MKLFPSFPLGSFPVASFNNRTFAYLSGATEKTLIRVNQFPCVLSLIVTGHKIQGKTIDNVILGSLKFTNMEQLVGFT